MNEIVMIPVEQLHHHPENPRLDLGDLTELAESIRQRGVMQNLTVVPGHRMSKSEWVAAARAEGADKASAEASYDPERAEVSDGYTVVIGNRRMEAAKIAGVAEVPCVISDMDRREQVATMLMENMQRADLTVYEQAQGFQMMMDLGFTPEEIGGKTGFSESTVRRRLKMAEMDPKLLKKAVGKQITMKDLERLGQLDSVKERNTLLKEYGENNFEWKLTRAIKVQKAAKVRGKAHRMLQDAKVEKVPEKDRYALYSGGYDKVYGHTCELDKWDGESNFIPKEKPEEGKLFYTENETDIDFYIKRKKKKAEPRVEKSEEEKAEEKRIATAWATADRIRKAAYEARKAYAKGIKVSPKNAMEMLQWALIAGITMAFNYDTPTNTIRKDEEIPIRQDCYNTPETLKQVYEWISKAPQSQWPGIILLMFEGDSPKGYADGTRMSMPFHRENEMLNLCYDWLTRFGYEMSDEEIQMMSGKHPCFGKEGADGEA